MRILNFVYNAFTRKCLHFIIHYQDQTTTQQNTHIVLLHMLEKNPQHSLCISCFSSWRTTISTGCHPSISPRRPHNKAVKIRIGYGNCMKSSCVIRVTVVCTSMRFFCAKCMNAMVIWRIAYM